MNRRDFLQQSGSGMAAALLCAVPAVAACSPGRARLQQADDANRFRLWRIDDGGEAVVAPRLRVHIERYVAAPEPVLAQFRLHVAFDIADAIEPALFRAWSHRSDCELGNSRACSFVAPAAGVRSLLLDYTLRHDAAARTCHERCATTSLLRPRWRPGRYVLAGPRAGGQAADTHWGAEFVDGAMQLRHRGGAPVDFDYLDLRVEVESG